MRDNLGGCLSAMGVAAIVIMMAIVLLGAPRNSDPTTPSALAYAVAPDAAAQVAQAQLSAQTESQRIAAQAQQQAAHEATLRLYAVLGAIVVCALCAVLVVVVRQRRQQMTLMLPPALHSAPPQIIESYWRAADEYMAHQQYQLEDKRRK